ncbi:TonB-dependent receptor [Sphingobium sp. B2D3C]|uniref:TonB-dependent receptor n=1 Tax=Sphingobium sp. B2D3C TaxID=2940581 RepID=UPI0022241431|nr:TonB-dependent receptor [Sphingobium sp. B2D3C]MCW2399303.1 iron complex outermembrane receptor protein [Sphingobium sp. B2D3C]
MRKAISKKAGMMLTGMLLATVSAGAAAQAQQTQGTTDRASAAGNGLSDIVVTATRQQTNVQDTPIAITAVTGDTLATRGIQSAAEISQVVPNATFSRAQGAFGPGVTTYIRGIGSRDTSLAGEAAVAFYIDDIYYPLLLGANFDLLDLEHVEVLRGPQGTLFGRNALAGGVVLVSKQPSLTEASGFVDVTVGAYKRRDFRAGINLPIVADKLGMSLSVLSKKRDGFVKRLDFRCQMEANGTPQLAGRIPYVDQTLASSPNNRPDDCQVGTLGGEDVRAARGALKFQPSDGIRFTLSADYIQDQSENVADTLIATNASRAATRASWVGQANLLGVAYDNRFLTGNRFSTYATYCDPVGAGAVVAGSTFYNGNPNHGGVCYSPRVDVVNWGVSGKLSIDLTSDIEFTGILGYRNFSDTHAFDTDGSPLVQEHTLATITSRYISAEARLSGRHQWLDWVAGVFLFDADGRNRAVTYSPWNGFLKYQNTTYEPTSKAVFANVTVRPFERLSVVLGGRYSKDAKDVHYSNLDDRDPGNPNFSQNLTFNVKPEESRFDWKAGLTYELNAQTIAYVSAATGSQAPGFNGRPLQPSQNQQYPGDRTQAYELGIKTEFLDRRVRLNAVAFYTDYKTRIFGLSGQEAQIGTNGGPLPGTQIVIPDVANGNGITTCRARTPAEAAAGQGVQCIGRTFFVNLPGKAKGFELELEARPVEGLLINGSLGYSQFTSPDLNAPGRITNRLTAVGIGIPEWTANAGIEYRVPVPSLAGSVTPRLDWFYTGSIPFDAVDPAYFQKAYSTFNGRLTYQNDDLGLSVSLGATNLTNKAYYRNYFIYSSIGFASSQGQPAAPREWYLKVSKTF